MMAVCEQGYLCTVCGERRRGDHRLGPLSSLCAGRGRWDNLNRAPEKHIRCDPVLAQFIVSDQFPPVNVDGVFSKAGLDPEFVRPKGTADHGWFPEAARSRGGRSANL